MPEPSLVDALERIKASGACALCIMYGDDIGCDDMDTLPLKRHVRAWWAPVGVCAAARMLFHGTLADLLRFDPTRRKPKEVSNPPSRSETERHGFYVWGTAEALQCLRERIQPPRARPRRRGQKQEHPNG